MKKIILLSLLGFCATHSNSWAAGRQLTGQHAPASTPALAPADAQKKFTLPPGFEIRLFAAEPDVINPVAMTWDDRGRLWVLELYEYPLGAPAGQKPRDRILILEDTDGDGRADKRTVFADGLNLATGLALGYGGVFVGQAPHFLFLEDLNGDDTADKTTILKSGFGLDDRHELLNGFLWGPDGWLYMTHGVFTHSKVKNPDDPRDDGVTVNAAVARYHPRTKKFEVFADGTSNPWGVDFDRAGNAFVSACVIDHLFHMAPGGLYVRQGGTPGFPYSYDLLPSIVDHRHKMAAYSGVQVYQGNQFPADYRGTILMGNIHDNAVHQDRLTPVGSSFKASFIQDFVRANDGWFMPVSTQVGPDGCVWIMDWYDKYPCYQNANADPDGVDREHGRIWRVVYTGDKPGAPVPSRPEVEMNLSKLASADLVKLLAHPNVWQRRVAQRLLSERRGFPEARALHAQTPLHEMMAHGPTLEARLAALWTLHSADLLEDDQLDVPAKDPEPAVRAWAARLTGERGYPFKDAMKRLARLAQDPDPSVRLAVATAARQFVSGSLTLDTPPSIPIREVVTGPVLSELWFSSADAKDPLIPFMFWMALEPIVAYDPLHALGFYKENGAMPQMPLSGIILTKLMRRLCDLGDAGQLDKSIALLSQLTEKETPIVLAALRGLIEGQRGKALVPGHATVDTITRFARFGDPSVAARAQELGALWGDAAALTTLLAKVNNQALSDDERLRAIQTARQTRQEPARDAMLQLLATPNPQPLVLSAIAALSEIGGDGIGRALVDRWKTFPPAARRAAAETLASRASWRDPFLTALEARTISPSDISPGVLRTLTQSKDQGVRERASRAIGRYRESGADKLKLIAEKRKIVLSGEPDLKAGREIATKTCLVCHKFHGEGAEVGPDLTGVGRSSLDALLANVIDPNQIIGKGYENVEIETKDGRTLNGRLVENSDTRIKLLSAGPREDVVAKSEIASQRVTELSVMPEGLEQMPDADFRNLIWYILNPPQDQRPLTPALRQQLIGEEKRSDAKTSPADFESAALWNPEWRLLCPEFEGAPRKLVEYAGRKNVLMTHPYDRETGAALERTVTIPPGRRAILTARVAAHEQGDWELRVLVDGQRVHRQTIDHQGERWAQVRVDLSSYTGRRIALRLENCANGWEWEFGFWGEINLTFPELSVRAGR